MWQACAHIQKLSTRLSPWTFIDLNQYKIFKILIALDNIKGHDSGKISCLIFVDC